MARPKKKSEAPEFESAMRKLEEIVRKLEEQEISLESSLELYGEGQKLARVCEETLKAAENRIRVLMEDRDGHLSEAPFDGGEDADADESDDEEDSEDDGDDHAETAGPPPEAPRPSRPADDLPF